MSITPSQHRATPVLGPEEVSRALVRMAHQIREQNPDLSTVMLVGIRTRGWPLARRLAARLELITGEAVRVGDLDITSYRDDLSPDSTPSKHVTGEMPFAVHGLRVVLVDDVLYTGRTARAALDAVVDHGRPARIQLAALIDRGHRELPIRADYVGKNLPSSSDEEVQVRLVETDGVDEVLLIGR